jgi:hypothetical protein
MVVMIFFFFYWPLLISALPPAAPPLYGIDIILYARNIRTPITHVFECLRAPRTKMYIILWALLFNIPKTLRTQ